MLSKLATSMLGFVLTANQHVTGYCPHFIRLFHGLVAVLKLISVALAASFTAAMQGTQTCYWYAYPVLLGVTFIYTTHDSQYKEEKIVNTCIYLNSDIVKYSEKGKTFLTLFQEIFTNKSTNNNKHNNFVALKVFNMHLQLSQLPHLSSLKKLQSSNTLRKV